MAFDAGKRPIDGPDLNYLQVNTPKIAAPQVPASAAATGVAGTIAWDSGFIYVCVATNTWKRVAIATW